MTHKRLQTETPKTREMKSFRVLSSCHIKLGFCSCCQKLAGTDVRNCIKFHLTIIKLFTQYMYIIYIYMMYVCIIYNIYILLYIERYMVIVKYTVHKITYKYLESRGMPFHLSGLAPPIGTSQSARWKSSEKRQQEASWDSSITLWSCNSWPWEMAHRNRWFTELKNGGSSMAMLNNQMDYILIPCHI